MLGKSLAGWYKHEGIKGCLAQLTNSICFLISATSSVAREGGAGRGAIAPPIGMSTKVQNKKNTPFLALLRLFYALEWTT